MSVAVTRAKRLGGRRSWRRVPGNAGGALAAYGARAALPVTVFCHVTRPRFWSRRPQSFGARVELVDGLIDDAGRLAAGFAKREGAFNVATLREPYRIEGKKTMAQRGSSSSFAASQPPSCTQPAAAPA